MGILQEGVNTIMIESRSVILRMRNVSDKVVRIKHIFYVPQLFFEYRAVYEIMWKNMVKPDRPQMTIWRRGFACWINKAIDTRSKYIIFIA